MNKALKQWLNLWLLGGFCAIHSNAWLYHFKGERVRYTDRCDFKTKFKYKSETASSINEAPAFPKLTSVSLLLLIFFSGLFLSHQSTRYVSSLQEVSPTSVVSLSSALSQRVKYSHLLILSRAEVRGHVPEVDEFENLLLILTNCVRSPGPRDTNWWKPSCRSLF